ncbi:MAG: DEAD/DEAH box helicase [Alphaproteobacteria bacterium]|nr:DEAD/DEAH box helicase [Alphaproteobacteria bacterium]
MTSFADLHLSQPLLKALAAEGYEAPTPIQARAIPSLLEGRDLLGIAQTGTGKTAAFALPILQKLSEKQERAARGTCRALILSPTRELASQISDSFKTYGRNLKVSRAVVFGGVSLNKQIDILRGGVDVLVATPGRLVDLIERKAVTLAKVEVFVLDEVDQMLDLGFIHAIRKITGMLPEKRQNLFFSATMPKEIAGLAAGLLTDPVRVEVAPVATTAERVNQCVIHVDPANKVKLLADLLNDNNMTRTLVFTRTKHGADKVMKHLSNAGFTAAAIHGNKSQNNRERALAGFKTGKILVLVATDIAARGIDVDGVSHVVNYDLPHVPESYVHRIGRTARAGAAGEAIAFCTPDDRPLLRDIEKTIRQQVPVKEHELGLQNVASLAPTHGWNPMGKDKPKAKPHHRGQKPNRNHSQPQANGSKPAGKPQGKRNGSPKAKGPQGGRGAPKRSGGSNWMTELGKRTG